MAANRQTYTHTTSANAVTLVWGSLRLAPIKASPNYHSPLGNVYFLHMLVYTLSTKNNYY